MKKRNTRHEKRLKRLIVTCLLCAIILTVSTYAWFIGMQTVSVDAFEINIASVDSLQLSLDGKTFSDKLTINPDVLRVLKSGLGDGDDADDYIYVNTYSTGNTNSWEALEPMSSVGTVDYTSSKMVLFEKGSLTASTGGYRIMAEPVANTTNEVKGYVAFDLFVKNLSGEAYYNEVTDPSNEEAIYLDYGSKVESGESGTTTTGIENSIRVAFAPIGRVKVTEANQTSGLAQQITCEKDATSGKPKYNEETGITGICRPATIWEPNDTDHVAAAITWFTKSCKNRTAQDTWGAACTSIVDGTAYPTYAISDTITEANEVDVYDGLNTYFGNIVMKGEVPETDATKKAAEKLLAVDTFTDTEKARGNSSVNPGETGADRIEFMSLAPNSITKVRVYVYLEGQDVDNYDFASLGSKVTVNFGFTKERFTQEDVGAVKPTYPEESE